MLTIFSILLILKAFKRRKFFLLHVQMLDIYHLRCLCVHSIWKTKNSEFLFLSTKAYFEQKSPFQTFMDLNKNNFCIFSANKQNLHCFNEYFWNKKHSENWFFIKMEWKLSFVARILNVQCFVVLLFCCCRVPASSVETENGIDFMFGTFFRFFYVSNKHTIV